MISLVGLGASSAGAGGPPVENIPGEFRSEAEAISVAKTYIDGRAADDLRETMSGGNGKPGAPMRKSGSPS
jgi:hypothetical protein